MARLIWKLRAKYTGLAKRECKGHPRAAIRLFCLECMGGSPGMVRECAESETCPLWNHRMGKRDVSEDE